MNGKYEGEQRMFLLFLRNKKLTFPAMSLVQKNMAKHVLMFSTQLEPNSLDALTTFYLIALRKKLPTRVYNVLSVQVIQKYQNRVTCLQF